MRIKPVGEHRIAGDFVLQAKKAKAGIWLETHPVAQHALKDALLGALVLWARKRRWSLNTLGPEFGANVKSKSEYSRGGSV